MINETMEAAGMFVGIAATEQAFLWTMSSKPWMSMAAGKGLAAPGVLNYGRIGIGKSIADLGAKLFGGGAVPTSGFGSNLYKFLAGGPMFSESLGWDSKIPKNPSNEWYAQQTKEFKRHGKVVRPAMNKSQRRALGSQITKSRHLRFAGKFAGALAIANLVGAIVEPLIYSAGRGASMLSDAASQPMAAFNSADWGNQLGSAYMTHQAVTERQRAAQMLQSTGITGHGSAGREARRYHG
jgi:hypothetical protein